MVENEMIDDFLSTLESNNFSLTNHLTNSKYLKNGQKIQNQIGLILALSAHIEALNNHHEALLISWNPWTLIKPILVAKNRVNDDFLFHR